MPHSHPVVVLLGFMGAGKSSVGRCVARALGLPFTDSDAVIETQQQRSIREVFAQDGEPAFRELEHRTVAQLLREPTGVLALGGGAAMHPATRELLLAHPCTVHLSVTLETALARVGNDPARPMLRRPDLAEIHAARMQAYDAVATALVITDGRPGIEVCAEVLDVVEQAGSAAEV